MKIGFIGLGRMGSAIAQNLSKAGADLSVYNRTPSKTEKFREQGVPAAGSARELAQGADVLFTMLSDDHALRSILYGEGVLEAMPEGRMHVSMSTVSPDLIRELDGAHAQRGSKLVSAPVFGRPESAEKAQLWVLAAGDKEAVDRCRPMLEAVGRGMTVVGAEPHKANLVKIAGNFMIASMIEALGESFSLVRKSGIEAKAFLGIINDALFRSPIYQNYGGMIAEEAYAPAAFKMAYGLKDVRLALEAAEKARAPMPLGSLLHDHYLSGLARGWEELDWAALAKVSAEMAGLGGGK